MKIFRSQLGRLTAAAVRRYLLGRSSDTVQIEQYTNLAGVISDWRGDPQPIHFKL